MTEPQDQDDRPPTEGTDVEQNETDDAHVFDISDLGRSTSEPPLAIATPTDDEPAGAEDRDAELSVPVDPPGSDRVTRGDRMRRGQRRPVLPAWATSAQQFREAAVWVAGHYAHTTAFHAVRLPTYGTRLAVRAPVGAGRVIVGGVRWLVDAEGMQVRLDVVRRADAEMYLKLIRHRDGRVRARSLLAAITAVIALVMLTVFVSGLVSAPTVAHVSIWWPLLAALVAALGVVGSPSDKPIAGPAVIAPQAQRLTADIVIRALGALGLAEINKALSKSTHGVTFPAPITRDGPGWRADVDLPYGVTVTDVMDRRDRLASGLRRPLGCVWPEPAHDQHAGRLVLWVGDQDMSQSRPMAWPLARTGAADLFKPIPFGQDQRGRLVSVSLMFANVLIGAMPRIGKTFTLKPFVLAGGLDPIVENHVFELKGTGDLSFAEKYAHRYASGPGDDTLAQVMVCLRETYRELEVRAKTIAGLPREVCPENKVTPSLARRRHLGLHPLLIAIDECQELFSHPEFGKDADTLCTAIIKRGPALGVVLLLATQRPDKDSLPTGISSNVGIRFCLKVMGQLENDMVLGVSSYRNGIRATTFTLRDRGIGYLVGAADEPQIVRTAYIDAPTADRIAQRARATRIAAGLLTGVAAGELVASPVSGPNLLDDVLAVIPASEDRVWSETVVGRLSELRPDIYAGWTPEQLAAGLKPYGVETRQMQRTVDGQRLNRRGLLRADVERAIERRITERDRRRDAS
jgi:S-DNA-T family DNA segregation ATPase FtsK/SpoIIIE